MKPRVLITPTMLRRQPGPHTEILERSGLEVVYPGDHDDTAQRPVLLAALESVSAMIASTEPLTRDILAQSRLRVVARTGVGYDSVDVAAATDLNIAVTTTPGAVEHSAAELTIALLLGLTRDLVRRHHEVHTGQWSRRALPRLAGKTLGILGLGRIGKEVAKRAIGIGMTVIAYDPYPDTAFAAERNIRLCEFDELLSAADVVSLHLPSTPQTADIINAAALAKMKRGSILVNTSRGATVDEAALCDALRSGHLFGAALDVFKKEPLPADSPLLQLDNVLLCTHMGGLDERSLVDMSCMAAQCVADLYQGRWPDPCVVNRQIRNGWKW